MKALVTGGAGFLGGAIARRLLARGDGVIAFQRSASAELERLGARVRRGDIADPLAVEEAVDGADVVFHAAAKAGVWGDESSYHAVNVGGTRNVVNACRKRGVAKLVHTSSPSVVFDGRDEERLDESAPYPRRHLAAYPRTKAEAERIVLAANSGGLATVALRPHLIWGPGDPHLVPRIVERARAGKLKLVGPGANLVDSTYVDNAAAAHVLAADHLAPGAACAGKVYFISNGEPLAMRELIARILAAAGLPPVEKSVPAAMAYGAGAVLEAVHRLFGRAEEPIMTRFVALQLSRAHWFDLSAARRDLGYEPEVSIDEGMRRLGAWLRESSS